VGRNQHLDSTLLALKSTLKMSCIFQCSCVPAIFKNPASNDTSPAETTHALTTRPRNKKGTAPSNHKGRKKAATTAAEKAGAKDLAAADSKVKDSIADAKASAKEKQSRLSYWYKNARVGGRQRTSSSTVGSNEGTNDAVLVKQRAKGNLDENQVQRKTTALVKDGTSGNAQAVAMDGLKGTASLESNKASEDNMGLKKETHLDTTNAAEDNMGLKKETGLDSAQAAEDGKSLKQETRLDTTNTGQDAEGVNQEARRYWNRPAQGDGKSIQEARETGQVAEKYQQVIVAAANAVATDKGSSANGIKQKWWNLSWLKRAEKSKQDTVAAVNTVLKDKVSSEDHKWWKFSWFKGAGGSNGGQASVDTGMQS
jgi:hypothetical protein